MNDMYLAVMLAQYTVLLVCLRGWVDDGEGSKSWVCKQVVSILALCMGFTGMLMGHQ